jgi:hypothetical protein
MAETPNAHLREPARIIDRLVFSAPPPSNQIPRRVSPTTLAMQMGLSRDTGTQSFGAQMELSHTAPFDYQSYLQRTRPSERVQRPQFRSKASQTTTNLRLCVCLAVNIARWKYAGVV